MVPVESPAADTFLAWSDGRCATSLYAGGIYDVETGKAIHSGTRRLPRIVSGERTILRLNLDEA